MHNDTEPHFLGSVLLGESQVGGEFQAVKRIVSNHSG